MTIVWIAVASVAMLLPAVQSALANGIEPRQIQVIDGDTITVNGKMVHLRDDEFRVI